MDNVVVLLDTIQSRVFVDNVTGMKFMIKVLVFAEFHAMKKESMISHLKAVSVFLSISNSLMEHAEPAHFTQLTIIILNLVFAIRDISLISVFVFSLAILMRTMLMENASVNLDTILSDIHAEFAHLPLLMIQYTVSAEVDARPTKFGMLPFVPADAFLVTTWSEEFAVNVMLKLKFMTKRINAVIVLMVITK
jgi:hypothetical protein